MSFSGRDSATYAQLYFKRSDLTLTLLKKDLNTTVRNLISAKEAKKVLDQLKTWNGKVNDQWKARADASQAAIDSGNPLEYAKVFKGLSMLERESSLRAQDKSALVQSLNLLTEELARSLDKTPAQARKIIIQAVS